MSSRKKLTLPLAYIPKEKSAVVAVIASVRVADFCQIASFQTCVTLYLQHLRPELSSSDVARHVGVAQGMFTASQIISAPAWGIAADRIGRKAVILLGLIATASACIGVAFSRSIQAVVLWRFFAGAFNGTIVAARAAMSDNLATEHRPAGFSLLVLSFHLANAVGPMIAAISIGASAKWSLLPVLPAEPSGSGVRSWAASYPYATPNLLSALVLVGDALLVWFKLKEVHQDNYQLRQNWASELFIYARRNLCLSKPRYERVSKRNIEAAAVGNELRLKELERGSWSSEGPLETVWTRHFFIVLCAVAILEFRLGVFGSLWPFLWWLLANLTGLSNYRFFSLEACSLKTQILVLL